MDRFPGVRCAVIEDSNFELRIEAPNAAIGFVSIADDGDEATVELGEMTHSHFNPYDASLSDEARAKWVTGAVLEFLEELFADQVVVWSAGRGNGGGWRVLEEGCAWEIPADASAHLWSRPYAPKE